MAFEETTGDPLVDDNTDHEDQKLYSLISLFLFFCLLDSLEEEVLERFERVLVHVVDNPKLDQQEVEHGALSSDWTIGFS